MQILGVWVFEFSGLQQPTDTCMSNTLQVELEVTLPGEGKDRVFKVAIKWVAQVSLFSLEEAMDGQTRQIPFEAIQALDVVMRHLPSMK